MNKKYIIFTDIDGTLYDKNSNCIPSSCKETLLKLKENGNLIFLCTGRTAPDIGEEYFDLPIDGMILGCGAQIIYKNETIYSNPIPRYLVKSIISYLIEHNIGFSLDGMYNNYLFGEAIEVFRKFCCRNENCNFLPTEEIDTLLEQKHMFHFTNSTNQDLTKVLKFSIFTNNGNDLKLLISNLPSELNGYIEFSDIVQFSSEIKLKSNSKSLGIKKLMKLLNIKDRLVIAIGDGINDIDMIELADVGISMGNGNEQLKKVANLITDKIDNNGFEKAFKFLEII